MIEETVWLGGMPVAVIKPNGASFNIFYVWTDILGSPRQITDTSNTSRWTWDNNDPFGNNAPNENPAGAGTFNYNFRLLGQYYDAETGLNYNYYRDYDPSLGRYVQSDPLGIAVGANTFAYAASSPIAWADFLGLDCKHLTTGQGADSHDVTVTEKVWSDFQYFKWKNPDFGWGTNIEGLGPRSHGVFPLKPTIGVDWYAVYSVLLKRTTTTTTTAWVEIEAFCEETLPCGKPHSWYVPPTKYYGQPITKVGEPKFERDNREVFLFHGDFDWYLP